MRRIRAAARFPCHLSIEYAEHLNNNAGAVDVEHVQTSPCWPTLQQELDTLKQQHDDLRGDTSGAAASPS